jgi:membrane dipeptidase
MRLLLNRRSLLSGMLAGTMTGFHSASARNDSAFPIGDMHAHLFFIGPKPASAQPLAQNMASGGVSLVSWSLVGDMPWIGRSAGWLRQTGTPKPGAASDWLDAELARVKAHISEQQLKIVRTPSDLDKALTGEPHVVLSVEGASFLDDGITGLKRAHDAGIRHIQLVHYVRNAIGDYQTEAPRHGGLTNFGRQVIEECNRLGILVDLAHGTAEVVRQALKVSSAPMVWSHSSVAKSDMPPRRLAPWQARQLPIDEARAIAAKGGVIGLWALRSDVGPTVEAYADRLIEMAAWLGDDHVAFGTDMNALTGSPISTYADLRRAVTYMEAQGLERARLQKIAIGNYARVLRLAMEAARS